MQCVLNFKLDVNKVPILEIAFLYFFFFFNGFTIHVVEATFLFRSL